MKTITNAASISAEPAPVRPTASNVSAAAHSSASATSNTVFALTWRLSSQALIDEPTITPEAVIANSAANPAVDTPYPCMNRIGETLTYAKRPANRNPSSSEKPIHAGLVNARRYPAKIVEGFRFRRLSTACVSSNKARATSVPRTETQVSTTKISRQEPKNRIAAPSAGRSAARR